MDTSIKLDRTNNNNINYYNDNNDNNNNIKVCETNITSLTSSFSFEALGEVKRGNEGKGITLCAGAMPKQWKFAKADLFATGNEKKNHYKLSLSVCKNGKIISVKANLNSPFRHMKRGLEPGVWTQSVHYQNVTAVYEDLGCLNADPRASKVYLSNQYGKGQHVQEFSVILYKNKDDFFLIVFYKNDMFGMRLQGGSTRLTAKQKQKNIIATGMMQTENKRAGIHADDIWD